MLTWCPWVWTSGAKHPKERVCWQLCCRNQEWRLGRRGLGPESIHQPGQLLLWVQGRRHDIHTAAAGQISHPTTSSADPVPSIPPWPNPRGCSSLFWAWKSFLPLVAQFPEPESHFLSGAYLKQRSVDVVLMSAPFWIIPLHLDVCCVRRNEENPQTKVASYPGQEDEWISQVPSNVEFHNWITHVIA